MWTNSVCFSPFNVSCQFNFQARDPKKGERRFGFPSTADSNVSLWSKTTALSVPKRNPLPWEYMYEGDPLLSSVILKGGDYTKQSQEANTQSSLDQLFKGFITQVDSQSLPSVPLLVCLIRAVHFLAHSKVRALSTPGQKLCGLKDRQQPWEEQSKQASQLIYWLIDSKRKCRTPNTEKNSGTWEPSISM